jgi:small GTP-binding protein
MLTSRRGRSAPHKVVLIGDAQVGKTSLLTRKLYGDLCITQKPTVGSHSNELTISLPDHSVCIQVWDTAGQEMYRALVPVYLREARAAILVFDVTEEQSFLDLSDWCSMLNDALDSEIPVFLVGNKIDLKDRIVVTDVRAEAFATTQKAKFVRASALTGVGVDELFEAVAIAVEKCQNKESMYSQSPQREVVHERCLC